MLFFINLVLHHKGEFAQNEIGLLECVNGEMCVWQNMEIHYLIVFFIIYVKHMEVIVFFLVSKSGMDRGLPLLENNEDILSMCSIARVHPVKDIHIYFYHVLDVDR
ncbi:hypothetical protein CR513_62192, partial [Mucuna pruriens]